MTIHQSDWAKGIKSTPYPHNAGQVCVLRATFSVPANIAEGDIIEMLVLPNGCVPFDAILDSDDLDTGTPAIVWDAGIMSGTVGDADSVRTCGDELFDGVTVSQAGGLVRPTLAKAQRITASGVDRSIGLKLVTDAATAAAGTVGLTVFYGTPG